MKEHKKISVTTYLDKQAKKCLDMLASIEKRSLSKQVEYIIIQYLHDAEEQGRLPYGE